MTYEWKAARGTVTLLDGPAVIYTPPEKPGADVISVQVKGGGQSWTFFCTYQILPCPTATPTPDPIIFQKGLAFPVWWFNHYCQAQFGLTAIRNIRNLGAEWIQLVPTWYQNDRAANEINRVEDRTATDECLIRAIAAAHNNGLKVMLKPHVDSLDGYFRGEISPSQPDAWFDSYEKMILHYADIACESKVEIFVVGTELKSMSGADYTKCWQELIGKVRQRYCNRLTYAANWSDYDQIGFWNDLDYVGIDAYFPLSDLPAPSLEEIQTGWEGYDYQNVERDWADEIAAFTSGVDRPLIFTEIGYASQDGAGRQPWRQDNSQQPNPELQARLYEAALQTFWEQPYFKGLYWWFWDVKPDPLYKETGYMPKDAALQELQRWYELTPPGMPPTTEVAATPALAPEVVATPTPTPETTATLTPTSTLTPTPFPSSTPAAPTPSRCQFDAAFVTDMTVPDNTQMKANQSFDKVWRMQNTGTCPWDITTVLDFVGGSPMSTPSAVPVPLTQPGETADVGVTMFAPSDPGKYSGVWQLQVQGQFFGSRVTVVINVPGTESPTPVSSYDWESCMAEGWEAQTWQDSQGVESVTGSLDVAKTGKCSLRLNARLQAGHENYSKGETLIDLPGPVSLAGKTISCWVYVPDNSATGPKGAYNGAQIFVKDGTHNEYGSWLNLENVGWVQVTLAPTTSAPRDGYMEPGFDPNTVKTIGVKIATNEKADSSYAYKGPFYVDTCTWSP